MTAIDVFWLSALSGLAVAVVIGLSALYQHFQFRRTGEIPVFTLRHVFTYGAATALSSAVGEIWNPPLWQKLLLYGVVFGVAWWVLQTMRKRRVR